MASISPTYASPGLRWGLCLEDHPEAYVEFSTATGGDLGIPEIFGPLDELYCTATIVFPEATKKPNIVGWKHIPTGRFFKAPGTPKDKEEHLSDLWNVLCTMALGRALKRAGYPDDIPDLKALTVWRMRGAQMEALQLGNVQFTMGVADAERAIDEAGKVDGGPSGDDAAAPDTENETVRALSAGEPPTEESMSEIRTMITELGPQFPQLRNWGRGLGIQVSRPATEDQAQAILAKGRGILGGEAPIETTEVRAPDLSGAAVDPFEDPTEINDAETIATIRELIEGLDADGKKSWTAYAKSIKVDHTADPDAWTPEQRAEVLAWLEVG